MRPRSLRNLVSDLVNSSAQKSIRGGGKIGNKAQNTRSLSLETLESRELLSVSPWLGDDLSTVQTRQLAEPVAPISLSDANLELTENAWKADAADAQLASEPVVSVESTAFSNATAEANVWIGPASGGAWGVAANWSLGRLPTNSDVITFDKSVEIEAPQSLSGGKLAVTGVGTTLTLLGIKNVDSASVSIENGAVLNAPTMTSFVNGTMTLSGEGSSIDAPNLFNIDNSQFALSDGAQLTLDGIQNYTLSINTDGRNHSIFSISGEGSKISLPNLETIKATHEAAGTSINATIGGEIELPALTEITVSRYRDFYVTETTGGTVNLDSLQT
ncbi:MAG: hypothetical protein IJL92_10325, partial [Thermoguttaceae bacterium]|nr:hypothetical protein [Thermoguttaceae bacterium]